MTVSKVSDTRLFPGKPITSQIMQEFDATQEHIAKRTSDVANDQRAFGSSGSFVRPKYDRGFYPVAETDFQVGFSHTSNTAAGTSVLTGSILALQEGYYDMHSFISFNRTSSSAGGASIALSCSLHMVDTDGSDIYRVGTLSKNTRHYANNTTAHQQWFSSADNNNDFAKRFFGRDDEYGMQLGYGTGLFRIGLTAVGTPNATVQAAGYVQICQRKEISTCPIGCERGQANDDTGTVEISSSSSTNTLSNSETSGRTLEPMKIYWS